MDLTVWRARSPFAPMRILSLCLLISFLAYCRYGDEDPQTNHFLLPDKDIHLTNGYYFEGNAVHHTCVSSKLVEDNLDFTSRCAFLDLREEDATSLLPNNLRITLKMQDDLKRLTGDMRVYVTHLDGVAYDFWLKTVGTTEIGSTLQQPVIRISQESTSAIAAELAPDFFIRLTDFSLEQADYSMNGRMHLLLTKTGENEVVDMEYAVFLRKVY